LLEESAKEYREEVFSQIREGDGWRTLTYRQLHDSAAALAAGLSRQGIRAGDRVALLSENRPEWGIAFFAILRLDAIVLPIDKLLKKNEIDAILKIAEPKLLIVSESFLPLAASLEATVPLLCLDSVGSVPTLLKVIDQGLSIQTLTPSQAIGETVAVIIFTSGTTGESKGVMLSHGNFLANEKSFAEMFPEVFFRARFLSILPLNHAYELTGGFLAPLRGGGSVTYQDSLKPANLLQTLRDTKSQIMLTVPALLDVLKHGILQQIRHCKTRSKRFQFAMRLAKFIPFMTFRRWLFHEIHATFGGMLRYFVSGGAPLSMDTQDFFEKIGFEVMQGYGLTETGPVLTVNPLHHARKKSVGKPIPQVKIKIDEDAENEILAQGPNVMIGYYKNPAATEHMFRDGYLATGDLGYFDSDGYLYISGRAKNVIVRADGKKVFPEEIEERLKQIEFIKEVCVLGQKAGDDEEVMAVVFPDLEQLQANGISIENARGVIWGSIKRVNFAMAGFKRIHELILLDEPLPKTTTLKVKRGELAQLIATRRKVAAESPI